MRARVTGRSMARHRYDGRKHIGDFQMKSCVSVG